ncbi:response regulator transcription factor [Corynebacterium humireducens]
MLIADDDPIVRHALPAYFESISDISVADTAPDGHLALESLKNNDINLILSDLRMPSMDGLTLLKRVRELSENICFVAMTSYDSDTAMIEVLRAGASGYILKDASPEKMVTAVRDAYSGGTALSPSCVSRLVQLSMAGRKQVSMESLSPTDYSILSLLSSGMSNRQIASELHYAESTIKNRVSHLIKKFQVDSRIKLALLFHGHV